MTKPGPGVVPTESGEFKVDDRSSRPNVLANETIPAAPRQERSRHAREALITTALSRFKENGYELTTVDEIAKHANVAVGGFYLRFRSKRQVLQVLMDRLLAELDVLPSVGADEDAATAMGHVHARFIADPFHAGVCRAWREATSHDDSLRILSQQIEAWIHDRFVAALRRAASAPGARHDIDIETLALLLTVLFWRSLEAPIADRHTLSLSVMTLFTHAIFEDAAIPSVGIGSVAP